MKHLGTISTFVPVRSWPQTLVTLTSVGAGSEKSPGQTLFASGTSLNMGSSLQLSQPVGATVGEMVGAPGLVGALVVSGADALVALLVAVVVGALVVAVGAFVVAGLVALAVALVVAGAGASVVATGALVAGASVVATGALVDVVAFVAFASKRRFVAPRMGESFRCSKGRAFWWF